MLGIFFVVAVSMKQQPPQTHDDYINQLKDAATTEAAPIDSLPDYYDDDSIVDNGNYTGGDYMETLHYLLIIF
jgi:hypothetical protein